MHLASGWRHDKTGQNPGHGSTHRQMLSWSHAKSMGGIPFLREWTFPSQISYLFYSQAIAMKLWEFTHFIKSLIKKALTLCFLLFRLLPFVHTWACFPKHCDFSHSFLKSNCHFVSNYKEHRFLFSVSLLQGLQLACSRVFLYNFNKVNLDFLLSLFLNSFYYGGC